MVRDENYRKVRLMSSVFAKDKRYIEEKAKHEKRSISDVMTEVLEFYVNAHKEIDAHKGENND